MIRADCLSGAAAVRHGFFTREGGVSEGSYASLNCALGCGDDADRVRENRARAMTMLELDRAPLCTVYQEHGTSVEVVETPWRPDERPRADALVTAVPGVALGVLTADCAPLLLADGKAGVVGAAHAGWRGALAGITDTVVAAMVALGADKGRIRAAVGPCIAQASYEVGPEFPAPFLAHDRDNTRFFTAAQSPGRFRFDLAGYAVRRLRAAGVEAVERLDRDTVSEERLFFSYRRARLRGERAYGSALSAIALSP